MENILDIQNNSNFNFSTIVQNIFNDSEELSINKTDKYNNDHYIFCNNLINSEFNFKGENKEKQETKLYFFEKYCDNKKNLFKIIVHDKNGIPKFSNKKRGKPKEKINIDKIHDKNTSDNLLRKIQVHYLSFIINYINEILINLNYKQRFLHLVYKF